MSRVLFEREEKEGGDDIPMAFWKELYANTRLMHMNIDIIGKDIWVPYLPSMGYFALGLGMVVNQGGVVRDRGAPPPTGP